MPLYRLTSRATVIVLLTFAAIIPACERRSDPVIALIAASATDAMTDVADAFTAQTGVPVRVSAGSSSALAQQILHGAPADVFLSASEPWADAIAAAGRAHQRHSILTNTLVLIVPKQNREVIRTPEDLLRRDTARLALADDNVPAGRYAHEALTSLGLYDELHATRRIIRGTDVRTALAYVARGEVDAAVVYATDAQASDAVTRVYTFDASHHTPIVYPILLTRDTPRARAFYEFVLSEAAATIFGKHGFVVTHP